MTELVATHTGKLDIAGKQIPCAVLMDGRRVISWRGLLDVISRSKRVSPGNHCAPKRRAVRRGFNNLQDKNGVTSGNHGAPKLEEHAPATDGYQLANRLLPANLRTAIEEHAIVLRTLPGEFIYKFSNNGTLALGIHARLLVEICQVYLIAHFRGILRRNQDAVAERCRAIVAVTSAVGINALVDESCDYKPKRGEYAEYLAHFLNETPSTRRKRFPDDYYRYIYRLHGWTYETGTSQHPQCVGAITNDIIYSRMPPGMLDELQRLNPSDADGQRSHRHHQFLTDHAGLKALVRQIDITVVLLKAANTWEGFKIALNRISPVLSPQGLNRSQATVPPFPEQLPLGGIS